jgi:UPF0716 protein FxsA
MLLVKWALIGLLVLPAAEIVVFVVVAALIGWLPAAALFVATSLLGVLLLRRSGRADLDHLRAGFAQDGIRAIHLERPGVASMLGGILLVFPGFITDLVGAALFVPALRRWATARLASAVRNRRRGARDDRVIDLAPDEYHQIADQSRSRQRKPDDTAKAVGRNRVKGARNRADPKSPDTT